MTPKRQRFVEEYLIDLNATQAAIRAGYSSKTAKANGQRLLTFDDVKNAVDAALQERKKKTEITAEYVLSNLKEVVERCLQRAPVTDMKGRQIQDEDGRDVWEFNAPGANKALELLGKHLALFTEKTQVDMTFSPAAIMEEVKRRCAGSE
ncbi:MAG: terminase small subunit [Synergistaceae bacterium]|jgi:phage terminase small subunit|nr:terminase small subunit [Synergistaceae bacterium]